MRKKFEKHTTRCDYNEEEVKAYFNAKMLISMEGNEFPTMEQIKKEVNNILGYIPENFIEYIIQMKDTRSFQEWNLIWNFLNSCKDK